MLILDSKTISNADTARVKGYDAGKKKSGIKLHIGVDILGLPHTILITPTDVNDRTGALQMLGVYKIRTKKLEKVKKVLADGGYTGEKFANAVKILLNAQIEVVKRNQLHLFVVLPKRWIVERTFAWIDKCKRFWKNSERKTHNFLQLLSLAFIRIILKRY